MKSNFAYISDTAQAAIANEADNPRITASTQARAEKQGIRLVASFPVADLVARKKVIDDSIAQRRQTLEVYAKNKESARTKLAALGITPLAFVPKTAWDNLCSEAGLYRLSPDKDGMVFLDTEHHTTLMGRVALVATIFAALAIVVGAFFALVSLVGFDGASALLVMLTLVYLCFGAITCVLFGFSAGEVFGSPFVALYKLVTRVFGLAYNLLPRSVILESFFPEYQESETYWHDTRPKTRLMLPPAPQDVNDILAKAYGLPLKVATMGEAIGFSETPGKIVGDRVLKKAKDSRQEMARRWAESLADPIIYFEEGNLVAVIAQFGDFPIEQELVERVMHSEHLL